MVSFPTSLDSLANPGATTKRNDPGFELHTVISNGHDIMEALEAKVGVGASTPVADSVFAGSATGVSGWLKVARARAYHDAAQSIADSTPTALAFNQERVDNDTIHDLVTNNTRLTAKTAGFYLIFITMAWASNATGYRLTAIRLNGTTTIMSDVRPAATGNDTRVSLSTGYQFAVNDYVEALVLQNSTGALNILSAGNYTPEFGMVRVG